MHSATTNRPRRGPGAPRHCAGWLLMLALLLGPLGVTGLAQRQIDVPSDVPDQLADSLAIAQAGDTLNLIDEGPYEVSGTLVNTVPVTIQADPSLTTKPVITMRITGENMFEPEADLTLLGLELAGVNEATQDTTDRFVKIETVVEDLDLTIRDCYLHDILDDMIRVEVQMGTLWLDSIFVHDVGDRTIDIRDSSPQVDTLMVTNSTFYRMEDKFRLRPALIKYALFDAVTLANTLDGVGIEFKGGEFQNIIIRNTLIVNCEGGSVSFPGTENRTIEFSNFFQDPQRVLLSPDDPAALDTAMTGNELEVYLAGTGNITRGPDPVWDQGEDPEFRDPENLDFAVSAFTETAFGSSEGTQIGDPRWGTYIPTAVEALSTRLPERHALHPNYPNPFNPSTVIRYELSQASQIRLTIYNVLGQEVIRLVDGHQSPGIYKVQWDGRDVSGQKVDSGIYFYRLEAGDDVQTRKMTLLQ